MIAMAPMVLQFWKDARDKEEAVDLELAMSRADIDVTKAAYAMNLNPSQWTKQRQGIGHPSSYRIWRLAREYPAFGREYLAIKAERMGFKLLSESELTNALLTVVTLARRPMAAMGQRKARKDRVA